jgi:hypothetical protein
VAAGIDLMKQRLKHAVEIGRIEERMLGQRIDSSNCRAAGSSAKCLAKWVRLQGRILGFGKSIALVAPPY